MGSTNWSQEVWLKELFKKGGHEVRKGNLLRESQGSERKEVDMVKIHCRHVRNFPIKDKNILLKSRILHSIFTVLSIIRSTVLSKTVNKNQGLFILIF